MRKALFTLAPAALLMAFAGATQAADNAMITITGNVQATTCDVRISTTALDLGTYKSSSFGSAKAKVAGSTKPFTLTLENCEAPSAVGTASLKVIGNTLPGDGDIFGEDPNATYGVVLNKAGESDLIKSDTLIEVATTTGAPPTADELNGKTLKLEASLAAPGASSTVENGTIKAPVVFQFVYN